MQFKKLLIVVIALAALLAGTVGYSLAQESAPAVETAPSGGPNETYSFSYQGMLEDDGAPANGIYDFVVELWTAESSGTVVASCLDTAGGLEDHPVVDGLFNLYLVCGASYDNSKIFTGAHRWLQVYVRLNGTTIYTTLPRQPISPTPYAWGLMPGAEVSGTRSGEILAITNLGSGTGLSAVANGYGLYAESAAAHGVVGRSNGDSADLGYGGYFTSQSYRGLFAGGASTYYAGVFKNPLGASGAGLHVDGTLWVTGAKTGYVVDIAINDGLESLETGDLVVITGYADPLAGEIPTVLVAKAAAAQSTAVVGVVDQPYSAGGSPSESVENLPHPAAAAASIQAGTAVAPGEYLSVVTLGSFKAIKVDASYGAIQPGDLLVASSNPGYAMRAVDPAVGSVVGKALDGLSTETGIIPVMVTLH